MDEYIDKNSSGSPEVFAKKMGMTKRSVYNYIRYMKEELGAPIQFSKVRNSYVYKEEGGFEFMWR
jgi:transcriptional antiterminator